MWEKAAKAALRMTQTDQTHTDVSLPFAPCGLFNKPKPERQYPIRLPNSFFQNL